MNWDVFSRFYRPPWYKLNQVQTMNYCYSGNGLVLLLFLELSLQKADHTMLVSSGQRRTNPPPHPTELGFSQGCFFFLHFCHHWSLGFLATVAFGLLSWGHLISGNIVDLIAQILFEENRTELDDNIIESTMNGKIYRLLLSSYIIDTLFSHLRLYGCFDRICIV